MVGSKFSETDLTPIGGGCINETYKAVFDGKTFFCKKNSAGRFPFLFEKERKGLDLIRKQNVIRVPEVIQVFEEKDQQVILLEWIGTGERTQDFWKKFGEQLAQLHQATNNYFGLDEANFMGSVVQKNDPSGTWEDFFIQQRLEPLVNACLSKNLLSAQHKNRFEKFYRNLSQFFDGSEKPSLVHGDLWSGNFMCNRNSEPVLIDPAVYYGHPAVDLGMTRLFGGFHSSFYESYSYHSSTTPSEEQCEACNLYPLLIHLLLFGEGYRTQIENILDTFGK